VELIVRVRTFLFGERLQKASDLLLAGGRSIELAADLGEPSVGMIAEVDEIVSKSVEAGRRRMAKVAEFSPDGANPRFEIPSLHIRSVPASAGSEGRSFASFHPSAKWDNRPLPPQGVRNLLTPRYTATGLVLEASTIADGLQKTPPPEL